MPRVLQKCPNGAKLPHRVTLFWMKKAFLAFLFPTRKLQPKSRCRKVLKVLLTLDLYQPNLTLPNNIVLSYELHTLHLRQAFRTTLSPIFKLRTFLLAPLLAMHLGIFWRTALNFVIGPKEILARIIFKNVWPQRSHLGISVSQWRHYNGELFQC